MAVRFAPYIQAPAGVGVYVDPGPAPFEPAATPTSIVGTCVLLALVVVVVLAIALERKTASPLIGRFAAGSSLAAIAVFAVVIISDHRFGFTAS